METIFDCFFEETFLRLERSGLKTKQKRKDVIDHLNAIISGCCGGQNLRPEESSRLAVLSAIKYHRDNKSGNSDVCLMGKYHNVLYIGIKVAWDWGVVDSQAVKQLLEEIYSCEHTFERIFLGALFGSNAPHFIAGWKSDFKDQDENTRAMVYFLQHATNVGLSFPVYLNKFEGTKMIRFIDIPIESCGTSSPLRVALQASQPDILLILLRYGAEPSPTDGGIPPVLALLDKLVESPKRRYLYQLVSCLKILLRTISIIEMPFKPYLFEYRKSMFIEKYEVLFEDGLISREQVFGVVKLKHLCRCTIRDILRNNSQLPNGINKLKLPKTLKRYIDMMEDVK
ncbi:uncharacterized protein LOC119067538 [Bradysia coprophila]|uniref:uncharacterized protein LOC119067538 n=1 Tax=Bradysia coprophila TaxID=38358 RepID=UPI00187DC2CA|nr:uncharacterized protein LOC119067538 [Bradysia coprophila]